MIVNKTFEITTEDINAVVVELADEIKKGYKITEMVHVPFTFCRGERPPVVAEIKLTKETKR